MSNYVISISREFGSGGRLIGKRLAARLGIPCYDRTLIQKTAEKSGLSPEFIARRRSGQKPLPPVLLPHRDRVPTYTQQGVPVSLQAFFAQAEVIRELADQGPCVIVGRCSDYVLGERPECLKVFIHGPLEDRVTRCVEEYHISTQNMIERVREIDRGRANYYNYYTGHNWGEMRRYDLTLDSSVTRHRGRGGADRRPGPHPGAAGRGGRLIFPSAPRKRRRYGGNTHPNFRAAGTDGAV